MLEFVSWSKQGFYCIFSLQSLLNKFAKMVNYVPFVVYFDQQMYACSCIFMAENIEKHLKMVQIEPFSSFAQNVHLKLLWKIKEKSLLVGDWDWLPNTGWHPKAGYYRQIWLLCIILICFSTCSSHKHDTKCLF